MEYNKLVAVSGLSGLFELISSKTDGAIVKSLEEKTTRFAASRTHQFSHLESIEIYTTGNNVNLVEVFNAMENAGEELPDIKDEKAVKIYFEKVYPQMDFDRVYASDMKKMVKWLDIIKKNGIEVKLTDTEEQGEDEVEKQTEVEAEKKAKDEPKEDVKAPAKKAAPKKATAKKKAE